MPPRIDINNLPPLAEIKSSSIATLKKPQLLSIAKALPIALPSKAKDITKESLVADITTALLTTHSDDTRFHKFTVYRHGTTGGAALKKSEDKAIEDKSAQKEDKAPSGVHKTLLEQQETSDPPGQLRKLPKLKRDSKNADSKVLSSPLTSQGSQDESDEEEQLKDKGSSPGRALDEKVRPIDENKTPSALAQEQGDDSKLTMIVNFTGPGGREAWILSAHRKEIPLIRTPDGHYTSSLKKLIPAALSSLSPTKDGGKAKISVTGPTGNILNLGTVDQFMKGNIPEVLELPSADTCTFYRKDSFLIYDVILGSVVTQAGQDTKSAEIMSWDKMKPLDVARQRADVKNAPEKDVDFLAFMNKVLDGKKDGYGKTLTTVRPMLRRFQDLERAFTFCDENWLNTSGGSATYRVPESYKDDEDFESRRHAGRPFNKIIIETALKIGHTIAALDKELFKSPLLAYDPQARQWIAGDEKLDATVKTEFDGMSRKQWLQNLQDCRDSKKEEERKKAKREKRKGDSTGSKKRTYVSDSDASMDSDEERLLRRKLKKRREEKKKTAEAGPSRLRKKASSDHLDESASGFLCPLGSNVVSFARCFKPEPIHGGRFGASTKNRVLFHCRTCGSVGHGYFGHRWPTHDANSHRNTQSVMLTRRCVAFRAMSVDDPKWKLPHKHPQLSTTPKLPWHGPFPTISLPKGGLSQADYRFLEQELCTQSLDFSTTRKFGHLDIEVDAILIASQLALLTVTGESPRYSCLLRYNLVITYSSIRTFGFKSRSLLYHPNSHYLPLLVVGRCYGIPPRTYDLLWRVTWLQTSPGLQSCGHTQPKQRNSDFWIQVNNGSMASPSALLTFSAESPRRRRFPRFEVEAISSYLALFPVVGGSPRCDRFLHFELAATKADIGIQAIQIPAVVARDPSQRQPNSDSFFLGPSVVLYFA
ncbi:hypothetical protein C8R44DRAFT_733049 [Mycena epipterygia]|nr:hypothetical protein C8R44DRAFT_733049 [Mycena epipterygia]